MRYTSNKPHTGTYFFTEFVGLKSKLLNLKENLVNCQKHLVISDKTENFQYEF